VLANVERQTDIACVDPLASHLGHYGFFSQFGILHEEMIQLQKTTGHSGEVPGLAAHLCMRLTEAKPLANLRNHLPILKRLVSLLFSF
jgi:hypothetical protein